MAFSKDEQAKAKAEKKVLVGLFVNGKAVEGFPYQQFNLSQLVSAGTARAVVEAVMAAFDEDGKPSTPK